MHTARVYGMTQLWILNIGDLKMLETPLEWYLSLAYDFDRWPRNSLLEFLRLWAQREFGAESTEIADILATYSVSREDCQIAEGD